MLASQYLLVVDEAHCAADGCCAAYDEAGVDAHHTGAHRSESDSGSYGTGCATSIAVPTELLSSLTGEFAHGASHATSGVETHGSADQSATQGSTCGPGTCTQSTLENSTHGDTGVAGQGTLYCLDDVATQADSGSDRGSGESSTGSSGEGADGTVGKVGTFVSAGAKGIYRGGFGFLLLLLRGLSRIVAPARL